MYVTYQESAAVVTNTSVRFTEKECRVIKYRLLRELLEVLFIM